MNEGEWEVTTKTLRDSSVKGIIAESRKWWTGINDGSIKFITALPLIADYIPAYIPGHVIIISGYTSAGKSQLLAQMTAWATGIEESPVVAFSLEDSRMEKMFSLVSCISETVHRRQMILGEVEPLQSKIDSAFETINKWPLDIYDDVYYLHEMKQIIQKKKPKVVFLDYVQKVLCAGKIYDRMSYAAHELFRIAQDEGCTLVVASQISVGAQEQDNPNVISLKGAGDLAEAAHAVIQLRKGRKNDNKNKVKIDIKKNKAFGNIGTIDCEFNRHWTLIQKESNEVVIGA